MSQPPYEVGIPQLVCRGMDLSLSISVLERCAKVFVQAKQLPVNVCKLLLKILAVTANSIVFQRFLHERFFVSLSVI